MFKQQKNWRHLRAGVRRAVESQFQPMYEGVTETDVAGRIVEHVEDIALRPHALH